MLLIITSLLIVFYIIYAFFDRQLQKKWMAQPAKTGKLQLVNAGEVFYRLKGSGSCIIIIEAALGSSSAEWWHIQDVLAEKYTVLTYDRPGYGWSSAAVTPRTSKVIATELHHLLGTLHLPPPYLLIGHSQGGLYMNHFARLFPAETAGCIFLDPLSPDDNRFKKELDKEVYESSGVDKGMSLNSFVWLNRLSLLRPLKKLVMAGPPFYYCRDEVSAATREIIWQHLLRPSLGSTSLEEYKAAHDELNLAPLRIPQDFPQVPLLVIYHSPAIMIQEIVTYGWLQSDKARKVEVLWKTLVEGYLALSPDKSRWVQFSSSSHFMNLDNAPEVIAEINKFITTDLSGATVRQPL